MLELKNIKKDYSAGDTKVNALKGISLKFRRNEFVSILGQSGCGKTTMLNIIGGLDQYTEGDLIINGKSTKDFKDRDWDAYRNHSIGFVFQSYNLIPHQTVLQNVEIALTLSGVSKSERKKRAKQALEEVGLGDQLSKKPSEMSGGQMQRVAIARALVNNPDIILADEPTGALDTETSVQVMEILKKISEDRLIIMVTHNPELANRYSTRIVRMLDGNIIDDSKPLTEEEVRKEEERDRTQSVDKKKTKMPSMSFGTSFMLSLKNLFTKKGRTTLTAFAGSIGIIGIALILAISQGLTTYIDVVQEETLSSYPLTIEDTTIDMSALMQTFMGLEGSEGKHEKDAVYKKSAIYEIIDAFNNLETTENDLKSFKSFIEKEKKDKDSNLGNALNGIQYTYDLNMLVYTENVDGSIIRSDTEELLTEIMTEYMGMDVASMMDTSASMFGGNGALMQMQTPSLWQEMLPGDNGKQINDVLKKQYDVVYGEWPNSYDEVVLVLDSNNELDDLTLYALGLESQEAVDKIMKATLDGAELEENKKSWSYEEICDMTFRTVLNADCYSYDEASGLYVDRRESEAGLRYLYDNGLDIKVTGIIRPKEDTTAPMLTGTIAYTSELTEYIVDKAKGNKAIEAQLEDKTTDIFTGLPFKDAEGGVSDESKEKALKDYLADLEDAQKAQVYVEMMSIPTEEVLNQSVQQIMGNMTREDMNAQFAKGLKEQMNASEDEVTEYIEGMSDEEMSQLFSQMVEKQVKSDYAKKMQEQLASVPPAQLSASLDQLVKNLTKEQCVLYYDEILDFSESTYEENLIELGYVDMDSPASVNLYASSFENKDVIVDAIDDYNKGKDELEKIQYTDYIGIMMSSITTIINAITYVLIAFVAISLIVSSIMIGVITLISVQERTKEIGILRAIGASKHDVSSMFNAETVIIGFAAGLLGVVVTYLLCIPINMIINNLTGINNLDAILPLPAALILILISMLLTLISGLIPSRSAAKKDPVVALRTE